MCEACGVWPAALSLVGVAVGATISGVLQGRGQRSAERIADAHLRFERLKDVRDEAASGYAKAKRSVLWLHWAHVEDSAQGDFLDIEEGFVEASAACREAEQLLDRVSALSLDERLATTASVVSQLLGELMDAWRWGRSHARSRSNSVVADARRITAAREALLGEDPSAKDWIEVRSQISGALGDLREAIASAERTQERSP